MRKYFYLLLFVTSINCGQNVFPESVGVVNDFEGIFTEKQKEELAKIITDFEKKTSNEIAIITLKEIHPTYDDFDKYCLDLSNYYGVGKKENDNGLIIVFSAELRKFRINTGTQTENILTNEICKEEVDKIIPEFKKGNYFEGIKNCLLNLIQKWKE
ncbi:TPM domain-containing protein [Flavobacterium dankookense]|uniref:TPM domain-containing protein n=1 Tax=Flavobacterium dankookense TaxID=706186 RepID=A0A4V3CRW8_9FLAO|nr:TPM domain-containing protein [Flavobacterium dankookense]TDP58302.1 uncharacterized protein BC748_2340 [Flavobacterium dankookense]